jgi:hypothetical protein
MPLKHKTKIPMADDALMSFVKKLVQEKGYEGVDSEVMEQIEKDVYDRLERSINAFIMAALPPKQLEAFDALLESADQEKINSFCKEHIDNLEERLAQQLVEFRQIYLGI